MKLLLKINPFNDTLSISKDGLPVPPTGKLALFRKSFLRTASDVVRHVEDDYNEDRFSVEVASSDYEFQVLESLADGSAGAFSVLRREFEIPFALGNRLARFAELAAKLGVGFEQLPCEEVPVFVDDQERLATMLGEIARDLQGLSALGVKLVTSSKPGVVNVLFDLAKLPDLSRRFIVPDGELCAVVLAPGENGARMDKSGVFVHGTGRAGLKEVLRALIERFVVAPRLARAVRGIPCGGLDASDQMAWRLLDKVTETVMVDLPKEVEKGQCVEIPVRVFPKREGVRIRAVADYRDIVDTEVKDGKIVLKALAVGDTDVGMWLGDEPAPFARQNVKVVDYCFARDLRILLNGRAQRNIQVVSGDRVSIGVEYEGRGNPKTDADVASAKWEVSDPGCGNLDTSSLVFAAKGKGVTKISVRTARAEAQAAIIVKAEVEEVSFRLVNADDPHVREVRPSAEDGVPEFVKCDIACLLRFSYVLLPEDAVMRTVKITANEGLEVVDSGDRKHFTVRCNGIGRGKAVTVSVDGLDMGRTVYVDVMPQYERLGYNVDTTPTFKAGAYLATGIAFVADLISLAGDGLNVFCVVFSLVALAALGAFAARARESKSLDDNARTSAMRVVMGASLVVVLLLIALFSRSRAVKRDAEERQRAYELRMEQYRLDRQQRDPGRFNQTNTTNKSARNRPYE